MKRSVRLALAQMLVILLLPVYIKTMGPPPPDMEHRRDMFDDRRMERRNMYPPERPRGDMMNEDYMHNHRNMPPQNSESQGKQKSINVTSGIDTDFKQQESIDHVVDTINAKSGGNWLLKRVWWEKTEEVYEQIKEEFNSVMDTRMRFISEYNRLNRSLDIFYSEIGIEQGPLRDLLSHAQDLMEKEQKEQGYLDKREQAFVFKLKGKERDLEQLKLDVRAIQELDAKLDEAFEMLFKQIDVCNQYEQKAWDNFKEIARELNDKEARKLYYDTEGLYKDIQKVKEYISGPFSSYFNQTIQSAQDHTAKISSQMNVLKNEGIDLVKQAEILEKDEEPEPKKVTEKPKVKQHKGWWYLFGERIGKFVDMLLSYLPKSVRSSVLAEAKEGEAEYKKLKTEADKEVASLQKEFNESEKTVESDEQSALKYGKSEIQSVEQKAQQIEDEVFGKPVKVQKKQLGVHNSSKHTSPHGAPVKQQMPMPFSLPPAPHFERDHVEGMPQQMQRENRPPMHSMSEHAVEHMPHRPLHETGPRRSITDHFQHPSHPQVDHPRDHYVERRPNERNEHELHNMSRQEHSNSFDHRPPNSHYTRRPEHDMNRFNPFDPGVLGK